MGFLSGIFGPSKEEIWSQLARECGGNFQEGGFLSGSTKVELFHRDWTITLDCYTQSNGKTSSVYTRLRAPYINSDNFRFEIYPEGLFSPLGKLLGGQDVIIGDTFFDDRFIIKANSESRVRKLLDNPQLKNLFMAQPYIRLAVKDDEGWFGAKFPDGVDELYFVTGGVIKDINQLKSLYDLFSVCLDQLCLIGSAYEGDPGVQFK